MAILYGNAVVGQSGGPTAAINATLSGVIRGALKAKEDAKRIEAQGLAEAAAAKAKVAAGLTPLEKATIDTIEGGIMTGDLYLLSTLENKQKVGTEEFLLAVNEKLKAIM
mgnify:CR=1 FL=1